MSNNFLKFLYYHLKKIEYLIYDKKNDSLNC